MFKDLQVKKPTTPTSISSSDDDDDSSLLGVYSITRLVSSKTTEIGKYNY